MGGGSLIFGTPVFASVHPSIIFIRVHLYSSIRVRQNGGHVGEVGTSPGVSPRSEGAFWGSP